MKKIMMILVLCLLLLVGCGVVPEIPIPNEPTYRALLIGVGRYENGWTLPSPKDNVGRLTSLLLDCKFGEEEIEFDTIKQLVNFNATKENILNSILSVFANADDNDVSYFYYMGHGGLLNNVPIITPTDCGNSLGIVITVHELEEYLSMIAGTKVVFLETCHAGNFINKGKGIPKFKEHSLDLLNKEGYQVLASSKGTEYTWDNTGGSYFCKHLIEGCRYLTADINKDRVVDLSELYEYIKLNVTIQTVQIHPDGSTFPIVEEY